MASCIPMGPIPPLAGRFLSVLAESHYTVPVFLVQLVCGILFLINRYVPLALTLIGPMIVNILLFHALMAPAGLGPGIVAAICWFIVFYRFRAAFTGILQP
jgi:putative oxidoreductase